MAKILIDIPDEQIEKSLTESKFIHEDEVANNIGEEYVDEFLEKYDNINRGIPIGGMAETAVFLDMIEQIKEEI